MWKHHTKRKRNDTVSPSQFFWSVLVVIEGFHYVWAEESHAGWALRATCRTNPSQPVTVPKNVAQFFLEWDAGAIYWSSSSNISDKLFNHHSQWNDAIFAAARRATSSPRCQKSQCANFPRIICFCLNRKTLDTNIVQLNKVGDSSTLTHRTFRGLSLYNSFACPCYVWLQMLEWATHTLSAMYTSSICPHVANTHTKRVPSERDNTAPRPVEEGCARELATSAPRRCVVLHVTSLKISDDL